MSHRLRTRVAGKAILIVATLLLFVTCASERRTHPACSRICGRVLDEKTGEPIQRFMIAVFSADGDKPRPAYALPAGYPSMPGPFLHSKKIESSDGSFEVESGPAQAVYLEVASTGYRPAKTPAISLRGQPVEIKLAGSRRIAGSVVDERGEPIANAMLFHDHPRENLSDVVAMYRGVLPVMTSDARGRLEIDEPFLAMQDLLVLKPPYFPERIRVHKDDQTFQVTLRAGVALDGMVVDGTGRPVGTAGVEARCEGSAPVRTFSKADGSFHFDVLPRSHCQLLAARTFVEQEMEIVLDPNRGFAESDLTTAAAPVRIAIP